MDFDYTAYNNLIVGNLKVKRWGSTADKLDIYGSMATRMLHEMVDLVPYSKKKSLRLDILQLHSQ